MIGVWMVLYLNQTWSQKRPGAGVIVARPCFAYGQAGGEATALTAHSNHARNDG